MKPAKCPTDGEPMVFVEVRMMVDPKPWEFSGWLCGKCRTIWSLTKVDDSKSL